MSLKRFIIGKEFREKVKNYVFNDHLFLACRDFNGIIVAFNYFNYIYDTTRTH